MIWPSRPDHDISLMIWPGRPNHDIEGWDLFSKKKGDSISSSKPFLEDAVRLSASANTTRACTAARREMPVRPSQVLSFEGGSENSKVRSHFLWLRHLKGTGKSNVSILLRRIKILYSNGKDTRAKLCKSNGFISLGKIIEYIMAFKRFLKVEMNTVLLHKNIGSRYYSQDRVHDPSRLLLVESIKKACDQCSDQFSITADEYDKMIDQIYAGDGQIECIGQFGVSVDIDTKNLIFHHQFDTRFPSTSRAFPSLSQSAGEGSSRAPLTSEDLPLLSQLRRDFIEGVPTGAAERDALAVEAKKGIEVRLA
ncbi:hypothetical protein L1987_89667 [Smallanthus sonchifolius]|nr:hypothetical protein L1987_89667 [Smallanthus sonchifolius]